MNAIVNTVEPGSADAGRYEGQISRFVTACLTKKRALAGIFGGLWGVLRTECGSLTSVEFKVVRGEIRSRLKASDFSDATVDTMLSCMAKLIESGLTLTNEDAAKVIPEKWSDAVAKRSAIVQAEHEANPDKKRRGAKRRNDKPITSDAAGTVAVDPETGNVIDADTGAPTGESIESLSPAATSLADPIAMMFESLRRKVAALMVNGVPLAKIEEELTETLALLSDEQEEPEAGDFDPMADAEEIATVVSAAREPQDEALAA